jgi:hypothetical protein
MGAREFEIKLRTDRFSPGRSHVYTTLRHLVYPSIGSFFRF